MMKQFQSKMKLTFSRGGKTEALSDDMQVADCKTEQMRVALEALCKGLGDQRKRMRKLPEQLLGTALTEACHTQDSTLLLLTHIMQECGRTQMDLASEVTGHEKKVEELVYNPLSAIKDTDLPNVFKAKKQLTRLNLEKESAHHRYNNLVRQVEPNSIKIQQAREEWEEADLKAEQACDALAAEMFSLLAKEATVAQTVLQYVKLQRAYHESSLHTLSQLVSPLEKCINDSTLKPVFGYGLEEHLRVLGRTIAYPLELCVCVLHEMGLQEEGLFRVAPSSSRMKRLKLSLNAGIFTIPLASEYRDNHVMAGILKCYLRELPEPLLTYHLYDRFMQAITRNSLEDDKLKDLWEVIHLLPEPNFNNLRYLVKFLSLITQNQAVNKMTPSNLAIVIAPNLLWGRDDGSGMGFNMSNATNINCIVELLLKHADWFFSDEINFFVSLTREKLLPDQSEYGPPPQFGQGTYNPAFNPAHDQTNGDHTNMSKSLHEYSSNNAIGQQTPLSVRANNNLTQTKQTHSRSNSHDTSLILVDGEFKRTQSNSSLSDISSPPQGSPKPNTRKKNKPTAPVPPNFTPPDKSNQISTKVDIAVNTNIREANKQEIDKPEKPPRPLFPETKGISGGSQTINRSTYKKLNTLGKKLTRSRENLTNIKERRKSYDLECDSLDDDVNKEVPRVDQNATVVSQHEVFGKVAVSSDSLQTSSIPAKNPVTVKSGYVQPKQFVQTTDSSVNTIAKIVPVAAPRCMPPPPAKPDATTNIPSEAEIGQEVQLRSKSTSSDGGKPAIPERPATLRPQSFRNSMRNLHSLDINAIQEVNQNGNGNSNTVLERTLLYSVDKQHPTIIQVSNSQDKELTDIRLSEDDAESPEEGNKTNIQRTHSTGSNTQLAAKPVPQQSEQTSLSNQMRKMSQSEGNILDVPPSPRPYHKPPRPQIPAPPPPTAASRCKPDGGESTKL